MHLPQPRVTRHDLVETRPQDDQVLIVTFLRGGADGLTLVPPIGDDAYYRARPILSVPGKDAIDLNGYFGLMLAVALMVGSTVAAMLGITLGAFALLRRERAWWLGVLGLLVNSWFLLKLVF